MTETVETLLKARNCTVVHKDAEGSIVVEFEDDGTRLSLATSLPLVNVGHRGKVMYVGPDTVFIRQPYSSEEM